METNSLAPRVSNAFNTESGGRLPAVHTASSEHNSNNKVPFTAICIKCESL